MAALTLAATQVQAQTDFTLLDGKVGGFVCPQGYTQKGPANITISIPQPGATMVTVGTGSLLHAILSLQVGNAASVTAGLTINEAGGTSSPVHSVQIGITSATSPSISLSTRSFGNLELGKRYAAAIELLGGSQSTTFAVHCFQMAPTLNHVEELGTGTVGATGCFAIGGVKLGGGDAAIRACFCGARNSAGKWARTDAGEGYEYMLNASTRTSFGCTTN